MLPQRILRAVVLGLLELNCDPTSQKSFPGSGSQTLFSAETSDIRKYLCVRRLRFLDSSCKPNMGHYMHAKTFQPTYRPLSSTLWYSPVRNGRNYQRLLVKRLVIKYQVGGEGLGERGPSTKHFQHNSPMKTLHYRPGLFERRITLSTG